MPTVFLSYFIHDARIAHSVAADLEREGVDVQLHGEEHHPWERGPLRFDTALRDNDFVLILISRATQKLDWFRNRHREALLDAARRGIGPIVPVVVEKMDLPTHVASVVHADLSESYSGGMANLLGILSAAPGQPANNIDSKHIKAKEGSSQSGRFEVADVLAALNEQASSPELGIALVIAGPSGESEPVLAGVCAAAEALGLVVKCADDVSDGERMPDAIFQMMRSARLIVADLTHDRPNVYFMLGYARCLGKGVITVAREGTQIYFDMKDWPHIPYSGARCLEQGLRREFEAYLSAANPASSQEHR